MWISQDPLRSCTFTFCFHPSVNGVLHLTASVGFGNHYLLETALSLDVRLENTLVNFFSFIFNCKFSVTSLLSSSSFHLQRWFAAFPLPLRPSHLHRGATGTSRMPKYGSSTLKTHYSTLLFQNQLLLLTSLFPLLMEAESNLVRSSCLCRPLEGNPVNSLVLTYGRIKGFPNFENAFQTPEKGYLPSFQSKHKIIGLFNESFFFYVYYI